MFLSKLSIKRPIMMTMILSLFLIFGTLSYMNMKLNKLPEVSLPFISVTTIYPGAGPKEIETQLSKKIEDAVATVSNIKTLDSYSMDAVSIVLIQFDMSKDINVANQDVKDKIDQIMNNLPSGAQKPIIQKIDLQAFPIMDLVLSGDLSATKLYDLADKKIKERFAQIPGVGKVALIGGQEREIHVEFDSRVAYENYVSLPQMMQILSAYNVNLPGGYFQSDDQDYTVRLKGKFESTEEINNIDVPTPLGVKKLRQFANVTDAGKKIRERSVFFIPSKNERNDNVVRLSIIKSSEGNAVDIAEDVKVVLAEMQGDLPPGVELQLVNDDSIFTRAAVDDTMWAVILGIIFTSIILLIFLQDIRSTIIVAISMPTSIFATFLFMDMFGLSKNIISLMGISVSVGVLVSNSVVVLENIFRHKAMGKKTKEAADKGTAEVAVAVIAATLTNVAIFIPLANMSSMVGAMLRELAVAATAATLMSLFISFTLTPMLASLMIKDDSKETILHRIGRRLDKLLENIYSNVLLVVLRNGWVSLMVVIAAFGLFFASIFILGPQMKFSFMPESDQSKFMVKFELPQGYNLESSNKTAKEIEERLMKYDEIKYTLTNLGKASDMDRGVNLGLMEIYLKNVKERELSVFDLIEKVTQDLSDIPNARIKVSNFAGMDGGAPIEFLLRGQNLDSLEKINKMMMPKYLKIKGLVNFDNSSRAGKPEIMIKPIRQKMIEAGLTVSDIAYSLRASIEGMNTQTQYEEGGNEYDILITMANSSVNSPEKIKNIPIISKMGVFRLSQLCDVKFVSGFAKIIHSDKYKTIKYTGNNATGFATGDIIAEVDKINAEIDLPSGYSFKWGGNSEMQNEMVADMGFAFLLAILLTYMLLAAILESFWQPVLILLTLPLAIIGVLILLYITDTQLGLTGFMGVIMLIGIVVNNAILIMDFANQLIREKGASVKNALLEASVTKLKAIIMSTVAIILGMLPLALGIGDAMVEMRIPLGIVSIGGLIASTILTLLVIPAAYYLNSRIALKVKHVFGKS